MEIIKSDIIHAELNLSFGKFDLSITEDLKKYLDLFEVCFGKRNNIDDSTFIWFNLNKPKFRNENFYLIDNSNDTLIAAYGLFPGELFFENNKLNSAVCTNVMVNPLGKYRGKGLFQLIGKLSLNFLQNNLKMDFALGVPNQAAIRGHLRIGWEQQPNLNFLEKKVSSETICETEKYKLINVDSFEGNILDIELQKFYNKYSFYFKKCPSTLDWRFNKNNEKYTKLILKDEGINSGFLVYKIFYDSDSKIRKFHIMDFAYTSSNHLKFLLKKINSIAFELSCDLINLWYIKSKSVSEEFTVFKSMNYTFSQVEDNMMIFYSDIDFSKVSFSDFHICLADNDVY